MEEKHIINEHFLSELKRGENNALRSVYEQAYPVCAALILNNSGTKEDAKDLFQEALMVLIQKLKHPDFQLTANIKTFMYAIVRNLWLKKLRNDEKRGLLLLVDEPEINFQFPQQDDVNDLEYSHEAEKKHEAVELAIGNLGVDCKKIIIAFYYQKMSLKEIAAWLDYTDSFIKVKKKRCMDTLKNNVFGEQLKNK